MCEQTLLFDNHGDSQVRLSRGTTRYLVCSRALARTPPAQKRQYVDVDAPEDRRTRSATYQIDGDSSLTISTLQMHVCSPSAAHSAPSKYNLSILTSCRVIGCLPGIRSDTLQALFAKLLLLEQSLTWSRFAV
ncbi:nuclear pore [Cordyceps militaris]|uniref:Nuclear pore n=1 Tax=Cordyceps militaris TaxID=73501 RepID=A0A2H4SCY1_CORMI|nr:nuclear pore [Cordyceps militaris]